MISKNNGMPGINKDMVFGVRDVSKSDLKGLELRYQVEHAQEGDPDYLRQRVYRDGDGHYYLAVKGETNATLGFESRCPICGREVLIPIRPEALATWAGHNLYGDEYGRALEEFKVPEAFEHKTVWSYQQDGVCEFLWEMTGNQYILFSTEADYPCPGHNAPFIEMDGTDNSRDDLYTYYVTPETARRWAEARGMDAATRKEVFGSCA